MGFKKGSTVPEKERPWQDCAYAPHCTMAGVIAQKTKTGWAVLCMDHWNQRLERDRNDRWIDAGRPPASDSIAKMRAVSKSPKPSPREHWRRVLGNSTAPTEAWTAFDFAKKYFERMPEVERQPGEDDEEIDA